MDSEKKICRFVIKSYLPFHSALTNLCGTHAMLYHGCNMKSLNIPYIYTYICLPEECFSVSNTPYVFLRNVFP